MSKAPRDWEFDQISYLGAVFVYIGFALGSSAFYYFLYRFFIVQVTTLARTKKNLHDL